MAALARRGPALAILFGLLLAGGGRGDEATLPGGRRLAGTLRLDAKGRADFLAADKAGVFRLDQLLDVRCGAAAPPPLRAAAVFQVGLADGQRLTGALLGLDAKELRLRTAWADRLAVARPAVRSLTQPGGFLTFLIDDFA